MALRNHMWRGLTMAVAMSATAGVASAQPTMAPVNDAPNSYTTIENHFKMPEVRTCGSTSAVEIRLVIRAPW